MLTTIPLEIPAAAGETAELEREQKTAHTICKDHHLLPCSLHEADPSQLRVHSCRRKTRDFYASLFKTEKTPPIQSEFDPLRLVSREWGFVTFIQLRGS